jgi:hypothetical protein
VVDKRGDADGRTVDDEDGHEEHRSRSEGIRSQADVCARVLAGEVEQASETKRKMNSTAGLLDGWNKRSQGASERTRGRKGERRRCYRGIEEARVAGHLGEA